MTIIPVNGTIFVQQGCRLLNRLYEASFPDNEEGMREAIEWASQICVGWHESQEAEWTKKVINYAA
ncbi:MAG: DUF5444 family protein [Mixta calida]|uniref:DUF5444 family protein n=1 Tax=Mixta calida TaxID=665913 RepID=UPI0028973F59|nr:DUF5444 family protein [Mixta calida]MDU5828528.1 DUF5444 family protein [Mixta calida]